MPFPSAKSALMFIPDGQVHFVDGPATPDLPARLYDANLQIRWLGELPGNFVFDTSAQPGWHTDGNNNTTSQAFRVPYYVLIGYRLSPTFLVGGGAAFLDRIDVKWIPLAGLIWLPDDNTRFELIPPKPRIAHRFQATPTFERWWYFAAEWGGGQWAIQRVGGPQNGEDDVVAYRDWRIINGVEQLSTKGGLGWFAEYGYVFGRHVQYGNTETPDFDPHNTLMVRLGAKY